MLVGTHDGGIDHRVFVVGLIRQRLEELLPDPAHGPATETRVYHPKVPKPFRQIAPWYLRTIPVQHRTHKKTVVSRWTSHQPCPEGNP
jgi:hypothetical protein